MTSLPYSQSLLDQKRQVMDSVADKVLETLFAEGAFSSGDFSRLVYNRSVYPERFPRVLEDFFESHRILPDWANKRLMQQGQAFFARHGQAILSVLGYYALPYCYAAADGAQVLYLSQKIRQNTTQRLLETGQFTLEVMHPRAFEPQGKGIVSALKVRLMHAIVRYHILRNGRWNPAWGMPVNQEDMAGTNSAFSYITLRGLDKLGIAWTKAEGESFLHLWKVIGYLMGVETELMPDTLQQAYWLDRRIAERHFRKSEAGTALTKALLHSFEAFLPSPLLKPFIPAYLRFMLGDAVADLLEVPTASTATMGWVRGQQWLTPLRTSPQYSPSQAVHGLFLQLQQRQQALTHFELPSQIG
jgi:hypothetical protein